MRIQYLMAPIALASTFALAQEPPGSGNIPAPDLFNSQIACSNNLPGADLRETPSRVEPGETSSDLDDAIGTGGAQITDQALLDALGYVIPSAGSNCGQGAGENAFTVMGEGSVATDIAEGYSALLPAFMAVYGDPDDTRSTGTAGAVHAARLALERAEADDTTSAARLTVLRNALARAQTADTEARAVFAAIADGSIDDAQANPVYAAAIAEWMAKSAVTQAIADYNSSVAMANVARNAVDALSYAAYAPLGDDTLIDDVVVTVGGEPTVNLARLREYVNATGNVVATVDSDGVYDTSDSNFNTAGVLVAPNRLVGGELEAVTRSALVSAARAAREERRVALQALEDLQTRNRNALLQPIIDEGVRRARAEFDYYDTQFRNALADDTNQNTVTVDNPNTPQNEAAPFSIASRHADFITASNTRVAAEAGLRAAAADREAATEKVVEQFGSPASFYQQLVSRREALKAAADKRVADAGASPSTTLTDAAARAETALTEARAAQETYLAIAGDPEGPVNDLVAVLLEADGDDGQALVDALSRTYGDTVENREAIDALTADTDDGAEADGPVTANRKAIDALTADTDDGAEADGPVTANRKAIDALTADTDDGAEADGPVTANRKAIEANDGEIEALDGRVTQNETDIDALEESTEMNAGMIATNAGNITANAGNIAVNAHNIVANSGRIGYNAGNIAANAGHIGRNAATLVEHGALIDRNAGHIALNSERIGANAAALTMHGGLIADNRNLIGELSSNLDMVRAGVAASIALSRMPSIDGGGLAFGAGTFAGEFAYAVGFQKKVGLTSFDIGVTSSGGEIGAGVGVGLKFWD